MTRAQATQEGGGSASTCQEMQEMAPSWFCQWMLASAQRHYGQNLCLSVSLSVFYCVLCWVRKKIEIPFFFGNYLRNDRELDWRTAPTFWTSFNPSLNGRRCDEDRHFLRTGHRCLHKVVLLHQWLCLFETPVGCEVSCHVLSRWCETMHYATTHAFQVLYYSQISLHLTLCRWDLRSFGTLRLVEW